MAQRRTGMVISACFATWVLAAPVLANSIASPAETTAGPSAIEHLVSISGIGLALEALPAAMVDGFAHSLAVEQGETIDPEQNRRLLQVVDEAFSKAIESGLLEESLGRALDVDDQREIIAFYESDFGKRIVRLESTMPGQSDDRIQDWMQQNPWRRMSRERQQAFFALEAAASSSESLFDATLAIQIALAIGQKGEMSADEAQQILIDTRHELAFFNGMFEHESLRYLSWLYQDLDIDEIDRLAAVYRSDAGRAFIASVNGSFAQLQFHAGRRIGGFVATMAGEGRSSVPGDTQDSERSGVLQRI